MHPSAFQTPLLSLTPHSLGAGRERHTRPGADRVPGKGSCKEVNYLQLFVVHIDLSSDALLSLREGGGDRREVRQAGLSQAGLKLMREGD